LASPFSLPVPDVEVVTQVEAPTVLDPDGVRV
jgi:hypothetical protein